MTVVCKATYSLDANHRFQGAYTKVNRDATNKAEDRPIGGNPFAFTAWSNAGARNHTTIVTANTTKVVAATVKRWVPLSAGTVVLVGAAGRYRSARCLRPPSAGC